MRQAGVPEDRIFAESQGRLEKSGRVSGWGQIQRALDDKRAWQRDKLPWEERTRYENSRTPAATAVCMATRSMQMVKENELFSTLHPPKTSSLDPTRTAPTGNFE